MKIDFHTHVKFTKKADFSLTYFNTVVAEARTEGLTALTLTEHFNTDNWSVIYDMLDQEFTYVNEYYDVDGFKIFAGMEIDIQEGGHVLFTGHREAVRELRQLLEPYTNKGSFVPIEQLFAMSEGLNFLKIGAHPFRESNPLHHLPKDLLIQFDALDLNGKDLYNYGSSEMMQKVYDLATKVGKPVVGGSDSHHPLQLACIYNEFEQECNTIDDLRQVLRSEEYEVHISDYLGFKVKAATIAKSLLKENMELVSKVSLYANAPTPI